MSLRIEKTTSSLTKKSFRRSIGSIWIDGTLHKQMMTLEFRETYFIIYQTFSSRTVLYISYKEMSKTDKLNAFKRSEYTFQTENKPRIIKLKQIEANILDLIKAKQDIK